MHEGKTMVVSRSFAGIMAGVLVALVFAVAFGGL
jgi:hypothetical protein